MRRLIDVARGEKWKHMEAIMTDDNLAMQTMVKRNGFTLSQEDDGMIKAVLSLE